MAKKGEIFRSKAYHKAMETIINIQYDILHPDDLKKYPGIGKTIMEKMHEYVATGKIKLIEDEKLNPLNILTNVYGIGPKKAEELKIRTEQRVNEYKRQQMYFLFLSPTKNIGTFSGCCSALNKIDIVWSSVK